MSTTLPTSRHSSNVGLSLLANSQSFRLAQVGPEFIIPAEPINLAPCDAEIVITVDGREHRRRAFLVDGIQASAGRVRIAASN